jgi:hypothetical protein
MIKFYDRECKECDYEESMLMMRTFLRGTGQGAQLPTLMSNLKPCDIFKRFDDDAFDRPFVENDYVTLMKFSAIEYDQFTMSEKVQSDLPIIVRGVVALRNLQFFPPKQRSESAHDRRSKHEVREVREILIRPKVSRLGLFGG